MIRAVLFDYDGVVIDSIGEMYRGSCAVLKKSGIPVPNFEEFCKTYTAPYLNYYRRLGVVASQGDIVRWYFEEARNEESKIFPEIPSVLRGLTARNITLGIVSAHKAQAIEEKLKAENLHSHFSFVAGDAHTKDQVIRDFYVKFVIDPTEVIFVGDLASDMRDGKKAGVVTVAFTNQFDIRFPLADYHVTQLTQLFELIEKR